MNKKILYSADEKPPLKILVLQSILHVVTIYSGIVFAPRVIAQAINAPLDQLEYVIFASLIVTAITTFIQAIRFGKIGAGYVLFTGTSASFLSCALSAAEIGGFQLITTMAILAAPLEFIFAYFFGIFRKIATHVVGGIVIMLIAVNLIPVSLNLWMGFNDSVFYNSSQNLFVGALTFIIISVISVFGKSFLKLWGPIIGILFGYFAALLFGMVDLSPIGELSFFGIPKFTMPGFYFEFSMEFFSLLLVFGIVTLVGAIETVGDAMAIQPVSNRKFQKIDYEAVQGALYTDGIGNILAGLFGTVPNSTYSGNLSIIELTGVASRRIGIVSALVLVIFAFCPWLNFLVLSIPTPVLGASMFIFFALLFVTGLKLAFHSGINNRNTFIIGISFWIGFTAENNLFFPDFIPLSLEMFFSNGIAVGGITAFFLSLLFTILPGKKESITLLYSIKEFDKLKDFITEIKDTFSLNNKTVFRLHLLCEEIFMYIIDSNKKKKSPSNKVKFIFLSNEDGLTVEIIDKSDVDDVDIVGLKSHPIEYTNEELNQLGLVLLNKLGDNVVHNKISNVNYISFTL